MSRNMESFSRALWFFFYILPFLRPGYGSAVAFTRNLRAGLTPPPDSHSMAPSPPPLPWSRESCATSHLFYANISTPQWKCACLSLTTHCLLFNKYLINDESTMIILILMLLTAKFKHLFLSEAFPDYRNRILEQKRPRGSLNYKYTVS